MKNLLEKVSLLNKIDLDEVAENGFGGDGLFCKKICVNFYNENSVDEISYSFVTRNLLDFSYYELFENQYIELFKFLYSKFSLSTCILNEDNIQIVVYSNFLSFKNDLIKALRENTRINILINEIGAIVNCNFDLNIVIYFYDNNEDNLSKFIEQIKMNGANVFEIFD